MFAKEVIAMGWIDEIKKSEKATAEDERIKAELKLRNDRVLQAKAPDSYDALVSRLKADCSELEDRCKFSEVADIVRLTGNESPILRSAIKFMSVGHFVRVARSYSNNGITEVSSGVENLRMALLDDDSVAFITEQGDEYRLVSDVSRYLIMQVLQGKPQPAYERPY